MSKISPYSFLVLTFSMLAVAVAQAKELPLAPLYKPETIQAASGAPAELKRAIRKAMYLKDWQIRDLAPGHLQGQFQKGDKYAIVVDVKYDAKTVSISYRDSSGLNFSSDGTIHKTYNERVRDLEKAIRAELDAF